MKPAFSLIFFTVLSGAGFGMTVWLGSGIFTLSEDSLMAGYALAAMLIIVGLCASTLHLGRPTRAIYAFSQWRSSWLSREGVLAIIALVLLCAIFVIPFLASGLHAYVTFLGGALSFISLLTIIATAMIYASLKTVTPWNNRLTPICYLAFALASGIMAVTMVTFLLEGAIREMLVHSIIFILIATMVKFFWWRDAQKNASETSLATATGLGHLGTVSPLDPPHMTDNYLNHEMGFRLARKHGRKLRQLFWLFFTCVPVILLVSALVLPDIISDHIIIIAAFVTTLLGLFIERWLFFAQGHHTVRHYYEG